MGLVKPHYNSNSHRIEDQGAKSTNYPSRFVISSEGFTLIEVITVTIILGILAAVAAPTWLGFLQNQRVDTARNELLQAIRGAQNRAIAEKNTLQVSIRENGDMVEWAVHSAGVSISSVSSWESLNSGVKVFTSKNNQDECETTFNKSGSTCPSSPWSVQFNDKGLPLNLGQFTLTTQNSNQPQSCIYISTLLGALRKGEYHASPNSSDKHCY